jgi:hypothetical protein
MLDSIPVGRLLNALPLPFFVCPKSKRDCSAPSGRALNISDTEPSPCMRPTIRLRVAFTARPPQSIPVATTSLFSKKWSPCVRRISRFTSSWTTCRPTRPRCSATLWSRIPGANSTSFPLNLPGSTRLSCGSPELNGTESLAVSSLPFPIWLANCFVILTLIQPTLSPFNGNTPTPPAAFVVTISLRQATSAPSTC